MVMIFLLKIEFVALPQLLNLLQYLIENVFISLTQDEGHLTFHIFLSPLEESVYIFCEVDVSSRACLSLTLHFQAVVLQVCLRQGGAESISEIFQCKNQVNKQL